ncbi:MAG: hypothetical protein ACR2GR_12785 [Rhodothermales bacterium]
MAALKGSIGATAPTFAVRTDPPPVRALTRVSAVDDAFASPVEAVVEIDFFVMLVALLVLAPKPRHAVMREVGTFNRKKNVIARTALQAAKELAKSVDRASELVVFPTRNKFVRSLPLFVTVES